MRAIWTAVTERTRIFLCGLSGHDYLKKVEHGRVYLECQDCPKTTPGLSLW